MIRVIDAPELLILAASTKSALAAPLRRAANEIDRLTTVNAALLAALKAWGGSKPPKTDEPCPWRGSKCRDTRARKEGE